MSEGQFASPGKTLHWADGFGRLKPNSWIPVRARLVRFVRDALVSCTVSHWNSAAPLLLAPEAAAADEVDGTTTPAGATF